jgi:hypothetical protein
MAGSLELKKKLNQKALRPLKRHVAAHATMVPFTKTESLAYIRDQLARVTEAPDTIFSRKALKRMVKHARGTPRVLNILCVDALHLGAYCYEQPISAKTVKYAVAEHAFLTPRSSRWLVATLGTVAATIVLGLLWFSWPKTFFPINLLSSNPTPFTPAERTPLVAKSKSVPPAPPLLPIPGNERQGARAKPPTSLSRPQIEAADGQDQVLEALRPDPLLALLQQPSDPEVASKLDQLSSPPPPPPLEQPLDTPPPEPDSGLTQRVVDLMRHHFPDGGAFPLRVWVNKGSKEIYSEGERLLVHVLSDHSAHLQMDYYQADGQVVHLLPHPLDRNRVEAGEIFSLGKPDNAFQFAVVPPFGVEMLTVVASPLPLDAYQSGPKILTSERYLVRFANRLEAYNAQGNAAFSVSG